ncbi:type II secretion system protein GspG [Flavivirga amylovorans]|uniref:Type II secretion system protein GspG n=1 Tax=Flavivirga amylovorans TaxID=870486 RepID=A0ABT8X100_9FLAO|nr:type II secretion system protein GspG [Flavivirga amylovorans]MDO5987397.1 type II secretion system protein GspG [Flavivirga amylovorans]
MIELILETLVDFGLIREDYKHRKRVSKKEKEDGIKRPIQKYVFQPSALVIIKLLIVVSIIAFIFLSYQNAFLFPKRTKKEISQISDRIEKWNEKFEQYPKEIDELIGNDPMKQSWIKDAWGRPYNYVIKGNEKGFLIISAGYDGQFETEDDIKSE